MDTSVRDEVVKDSVQIAMELQQLRDSYFASPDSSLFYKTISLFIGNFCVRYPLLIHELIEVKLSETTNNEVVYKAFVHIQGDARFLMEMFLTICHLLNHPKDKRELACLSLQLSELIHIDKQDRVLLEVEANNNTESKLLSNHKRYEKIVALAEKADIVGLPRSIEECTPFIVNKVGLNFHRFGKIQYSDESENMIVKESLASVKKDFEQLTKTLYAILSFRTHPTHYSLEKIDRFIRMSRQGKIDIISDEKFEVLSLVRPVAQATLFSLKKYLN